MALASSCGMSNESCTMPTGPPPGVTPPASPDDDSYAWQLNGLALLLLGIVVVLLAGIAAVVVARRTGARRARRQSLSESTAERADDSDAEDMLDESSRLRKALTRAAARPSWNGCLNFTDGTNEYMVRGEDRATLDTYLRSTTPAQEPELVEDGAGMTYVAFALPDDAHVSLVHATDDTSGSGRQEASGMPSSAAVAAARRAAFDTQVDDAGDGAAAPLSAPLLEERSLGSHVVVVEGQRAEDLDGLACVRGEPTAAPPVPVAAGEPPASEEGADLDHHQHQQPARTTSPAPQQQRYVFLPVSVHTIPSESEYNYRSSGTARKRGPFSVSTLNSEPRFASSRILTPMTSTSGMRPASSFGLFPSTPPRHSGAVMLPRVPSTTSTSQLHMSTSPQHPSRFTTSSTRGRASRRIPVARGYATDSPSRTPQASDLERPGSDPREGPDAVVATSESAEPAAARHVPSSESTPATAAPTAAAATAWDGVDDDDEHDDDYDDRSTLSGSSARDSLEDAE